MDFIRFYMCRTLEFTDLLRSVVLKFLGKLEIINLRLVSKNFEDTIACCIIEDRFSFPRKDCFQLEEDNRESFMNFLKRTRYRSYSILDELGTRIFVNEHIPHNHRLKSLELEIKENMGKEEDIIHYGNLERYKSIDNLSFRKGLWEGIPNYTRYNFLESLFSKVEIKSIAIADKLDIIVTEVGEKKLLDFLLLKKDGFDEISIKLISQLQFRKVPKFTKEMNNLILYFFKEINTKKINGFFRSLVNQSELFHAQELMLEGLTINPYIQEIVGLSIFQYNRILEKQGKNGEVKKLRKIDCGFVDSTDSNVLELFNSLVEKIKYNMCILEFVCSVSASSMKGWFYCKVIELLLFKTKQLDLFDEALKFSVGVKLICDSFKCDCLDVNDCLLNGIMKLFELEMDHDNISVKVEIKAASKCTKSKIAEKIAEMFGGRKTIQFS